MQARMSLMEADLVRGFSFRSVSRVSFRHGAGLAPGPDGVDAVGENLKIKGLERTYKGGAGRAHMRPVPC